MESTKIDSLHIEHREWLKKLDFYQEDLTILKRRLEEIAAKNTAKDVLSMVEHFQNQFIIQKNEIDEFRHSIKILGNEIESIINKNPIAINRQRIEDHPELRERMERFEKIFHELRMELMRFASKNF